MDKPLKKLNKTELLWIIRDQEEEIINLKKRIAELEGKSEEHTEIISEEKSDEKKDSGNGEETEEHTEKTDA